MIEDTEINLRNFDEEHVAAVPVLRQSYSELKEYDGDTPLGTHTVCEEIVLPLIRRVPANSVKRRHLKEIFVFIEKMARSGPWISDVLCLSILDFLLEDPPWLERVRGYFGPATEREVVKYVCRGPDAACGLGVETCGYATVPAISIAGELRFS